MSTRGCLIKLEKEVCKVAYLHYGADFVGNYIYDYRVGEKFWDKVFDAAKEWDEFDGMKNFCYREVTDAESIERLYKYDAGFLIMDADVFIFVEHKPETNMYDVTIKKDLGVDNSKEWQERWEAKDKEKDWIRTLVGVKLAKELAD